MVVMSHGRDQAENADPSDHTRGGYRGEEGREAPEKIAATVRTILGDPSYRINAGASRRGCPS